MAFSQLIYHINYLRQLYPDERILMTKVDWKSAYRRIHLRPSTAVRSCTSIDGLLLIALRMTFGGSPNPAQWSDVSEEVTDLANDLVRRSDWDPQQFKSFLGCIGQYLDPFLGRFGRTQKIEIFASFAAALRGERLSAGQREGSRHGRKSGTIRTTLDGVAQTFRRHKFESPIHDEAGRLEPVLALQLKGYANEDPDPRPQQALPLEVVRRVLAMRSTARDEAIGQLVVTAFFFAMRSCEYSHAGQGRITTVVTIDDVLFRKDGKTIPTDDRELMRLADTVSITFRKQKNQDNGTTITQHRNDRPGQADICPMRSLADLVSRIRG